MSLIRKLAVIFLTALQTLISFPSEYPAQKECTTAEPEGALSLPGRAGGSHELLLVSQAASVAGAIAGLQGCLQTKVQSFRSWEPACWHPQAAPLLPRELSALHGPGRGESWKSQLELFQGVEPWGPLALEFLSQAAVLLCAVAFQHIS